MRVGFSDEQQLLRRQARRFLAEASSSAQVRAAIAGERGYHVEVYRQMAELGWTGLTIPEAYGGAGLGAVELVALMEEMGRVLLCAPFFSSVCLAASALMEGGSEAQRREHLPELAAGRRLGTVAVAERDGRYEAAAVETVAARDDGWVLTGTKRFVPDGLYADLVLVAARAEGEVSLFLVPADAAGLSRRALPTLDPTRRQAEVRLDGVRVPTAARLDGGFATVERTLDRARVALAAEQLGGAARCLEMAVEHARTRVQFGRPIGSFQAIKHACADLLVAVESARAAAYWAGWVAAHEPSELATAAALAKATCSEAFFRCAAQSIQIHGGLGFTWEHDAQLYFKRARSTEILLGDPPSQRERIARQLGL